MANSKHGNNQKGPSRVRYHSSGRLVQNKIRRITKNNGLDFLKRWKDKKGVK